MAIHLQQEDPGFISDTLETWTECCLKGHVNPQSTFSYSLKVSITLLKEPSPSAKENQYILSYAPPPLILHTVPHMQGHWVSLEHFPAVSEAKVTAHPGETACFFYETEI